MAKKLVRKGRKGPNTNQKTNKKVAHLAVVTKHVEKQGDQEPLCKRENHDENSDTKWWYNPGMNPWSDEEDCCEDEDWQERAGNKSAPLFYGTEQLERSSDEFNSKRTLVE